MLKRITITAAGVAACAGLLSTLFGQGIAVRGWDWLFSKPPERSTRTLQVSENSQVTVVVFRRGKGGGYATLGDIGQRAMALGFRTLNWGSEGMLNSMEKGWGVSPSMLEGRGGGIFYYPPYQEKAALLQRALVAENPGLAKTIPLMEVKASSEGVFIDRYAVAQDSLLVYAPD